MAFVVQVAISKFLFYRNCFCPHGHTYTYVRRIHCPMDTPNARLFCFLSFSLAFFLSSFHSQANLSVLEKVSHKFSISNAAKCALRWQKSNSNINVSHRRHYIKVKSLDFLSYFILNYLSSSSAFQI